MEENFYSGFVSIIGKPNVGKSTLLNCLAGGKVAITSNKPQTTRNSIQAILTTEDTQYVFIDTPGIHKPQTKLGDYMLKSVENALSEMDVILMLVEPTEKLIEANKPVIELLKNVNSPVILVINKIDAVDKSKILGLIEAYTKLYNFSDYIPVSALKGKNTDELLRVVKKYFMPGPKYFPDDAITDQPERSIVSEIIREKALMLLQEEIPHGIAVEITGMKKRDGSDIVDVDAIIYCEKDSHKGIIIGKQGAVIKTIGQKARTEIENLLGSKIFLQTWVKVKKNWRDSDFMLKNLGYDIKNMY